MDVEQLLVREFLSSHSEEAARLLEQLPLDQAVAVLNEAPVAAARSLSGMAAHLAVRCLEKLETAKGCALIEALPAAAATVFLRRMEPQKREALLGGIAADARERLGTLLLYPEETAGAIMDPLTATLPGDIPVEEARGRLREFPAHLYYYVYVVNRDQTLSGVVGLRELFMADGEDLVRSVMKPKVMNISDHDPLAAVLAHPGWRDFHALPVVSDDGVFRGMIRHRTVRRLAEAEQAEHGPPALETLFALGELYWTGMVELFGGMSSATRPPRQQ